MLRTGYKGGLNTAGPLLVDAPNRAVYRSAKEVTIRNRFFSRVPGLWDDPEMGHGGNGNAAAKTGVNDHAWEREHRHATTRQLRAVGYRGGEAGTKLEQHQQEARQRAGAEHKDQDD
jgi:hypothetical protein